MRVGEEVVSSATGSGVIGKKSRGGQYNIFIITKTLTPLPLTS
jgi:hypothetical protein